VNTVRLRLTLLYVGLFLASAAVLLGITYVLVARAVPQTQVLSSTSGAQGGCPQPGGALPASPGDLNGCVNYLLQQEAQLRADTLDRLLLESGVALGIMAVASVGLGWLMAGRVLRPLRTITATARRISARNLHERLALTGPADELKELGDTFDQLLARLDASFRAQRQFVANASHELRTPLARQRTLLEVALRDQSATSEQLRAACERAIAAGEQHERLIAAMLTLAQSERGLDRSEPFDLAELAEDTLAAHDESGLAFTAALTAAPVRGDPRMAERLVANLIDNAVRYNGPDGQVWVSTGQRDDGRPFLRVINTGVAVEAGELTRLFQPFQRAAPSRGTGGFGLGLAIVAAIATAHDAEVQADPRPGGGLRVEIVFTTGAAPA
jgi:signal transduction histidine kinase